MVCNSSASAPFGPCPPCPGITRKDGTPPCHLKKSVGEVQAVTGEKKDKFSTASVQGWYVCACLLLSAPCVRYPQVHLSHESHKHVRTNAHTHECKNAHHSHTHGYLRTRPSILSNATPTPAREWHADTMCATHGVPTFPVKSNPAIFSLRTSRKKSDYCGLYFEKT